MSVDVLFRARNRRGLGHLMRVRNLATAVQALTSDVNVHVHSTRRPPSGLWDPAIAMSSDEDQPWADAARALRPRVVVLDTMIEADDRRCARSVLVMRKRSPEQHAALLSDPAIETIDRFIVPHTREEFDFALPPSIERRSTFVGPISRGPSLDRTLTRGKYGSTDDDFLVTVTVGGGGFGAQADRFFELAGAMVTAIRIRRPNLAVVVVLGPNYDNPATAARLAALPRTTVVPHATDLVDLLAASDLVIAEGGYNTVNEVRLTQVPAVFIPSERSLDDQVERTRRVESTGAAMVVLPGTTDATASARVAELARHDDALRRMRVAATANPLHTGNADAARVIVEEVSR